MDVTPRGEHIHTSTSNRRFQLRDALVLTGAVAIALAAYCALTSGRGFPPDFLNRLIHVRFLFLLVLLTLSWALGVLVLADTRKLAESAKSPGRLALLLILAASLAAIAMSWGELLTAPYPMWTRLIYLPFSIVELPVAPAAPAFASISGWLTLRLAQIPRPRSEWLDLAGRIVGWIWIVYAISFPLFDWRVLQAIGVTK